MESVLIVVNFACAMFVCGRNVRAGCTNDFFPAYSVIENHVNRKYSGK